MHWSWRFRMAGSAPAFCENMLEVAPNIVRADCLNAGRPSGGGKPLDYHGRVDDLRVFTVSRSAGTFPSRSSLTAPAREKSSTLRT